MKGSEYKIAYYVQTDIQHIPPVVSIYPFLGGIVFTTNKKIYNFTKEKYPHIQILWREKRFQLQKEIVKRKIRVVVYPSYNILYRGASVQIFHGVSDKAYIENPKVMLYDLVLFVGKKSMLKVKRTGFLNRVREWKIVGYPKFDEIIKDKSSPPVLFKNNRKTILYAPTWISSDAKMRVLKFSNHGESSLPIFGTDIIKALYKDYNLIIKYHNRAYRSKNPIYEKINGLIHTLGAEEHVKCIWDDNILPYMKISDLMITDISTVCYEWFHFDRPIIFANPSPEYYKPSDDIFSNTYAWQAGDVIYRPDQIREIVENNLKTDRYKKRRNDLFYEAFYKPDGHAAERQAREIIRLYEKIKNKPYHFFIFSYYIRRRLTSYRIKWLNRVKKVFKQFTYNYK